MKTVTLYGARLAIKQIQTCLKAFGELDCMLDDVNSIRNYLGMSRIDKDGNTIDGSIGNESTGKQTGGGNDG